MDNDIILKGIPDKRQDKNTTSLVMKEDLIDFFKDTYSNKKCLEIGTNRGYTTRMLSFLFEKVKTIEVDNRFINLAKELNKDRDNIEYVCGDAYNMNNLIQSNSWWEEETTVSETEKFDVFFIDCIHEGPHVLIDIDTAFKDGTDDVILVFDDYGLPEDRPDVNYKGTIDKCVDSGLLKFVKHIGEPAGNEPRIGRRLVDWEGIICQKGTKD